MPAKKPKNDGQANATMPPANGNGDTLANWRRADKVLTMVIAIGGNAILRSDQLGTAEEQLANVATTCTDIVDLVEKGNKLILTHGNGPQVGNILIQMEEASAQVPAMPLDVAVSMSQGQIGYILQQALGDELDRRELFEKSIACVVTQVLVDPIDKAFRNPTKPIGPFYSMTKAKQMMSQKNWKMVEITEKAKWRRVVPSPMPIKVIEAETIKAMADAGTLVIAAGGGGIPVVRMGYRLKGVEAVIDKDHATSVLATNVKADVFVILTAVEKVAINFGKKDQKWLDRMTTAEALHHLKQGQFPEGSMGPKVEAAVAFVKATGNPAIITSTEKLIEALDGKTGTRIVP